MLLLLLSSSPSSGIIPNFVASEATVFTPAVSGGIAPGFIASSAQVFEPSVDQHIQDPGFILARGDQSPIHISGLVGHYVADDVAGSDGDPVSALVNRVVGTPDFAAAGAVRPTIKRSVFGGHDALRFDGSNDSMLSGGTSDWRFLHDGTGATVFVVWRHNGTPDPGVFDSILSTGIFSASSVGFNLAFDDLSFDNRIRVQVGRGSAPSVADFGSLDDGVRVDEGYITCAEVETVQVGLWTNGSLAGGRSAAAAATPSSSNASTGLRLGSYHDGTFSLNGDIAELVVFDRVLTTPERVQVTEYLANRYLIEAATLEDESVALDDSGHNAFPGFAVCGNGDYLAVYRDGSSHSSTDGAIKTIRSTDGGLTWGGPSTVLTGGGWDYRDPSLTKLGDGTLILTVGRRTSAGAEGTSGAILLSSTDHGSTWSSPLTLTSVSTDWVRGGAPVLELDDGDLLTCTYMEDSGDSYASVELFRSVDGGSSWSSEGVIADGQADGRAYNESSISQLSDGSLICLMRQGNAALWKMTSADGGLTWSSPTAALSGAWSWPKAAVDHDDRLYVLLRAADNSSTWAHSSDGGDNWSWGRSVRSGGYEHGYAQSVLVDNKVLTFYSYEHSSTNADLYLLVEEIPLVDGPQVFVPGVNLVVEPNFIVSTAQIFNPQLDLRVEPNFIVSTAQIYAPAIPDLDSFVEPSLITSTAQVFNPVVEYQIDPANIVSTVQVFAPQVNLRVEPNFIASTAQTFNPGTTFDVEPSLIASTSQVFNPNVEHQIDPTNIASTSQVFNPNVRTLTTIELPLVPSAAQVHGPKVILRVEPNFIVSTAQTFNPVVVPGEVTISSGFIASESSVATPKVNLHLHLGFLSSSASVLVPGLGLLVSFRDVTQVITLSSPAQSIGLFSPAQSIDVVDPTQTSDVVETITTLQEI